MKLEIVNRPTPACAAQQYAIRLYASWAEASVREQSKILTSHKKY